jgi:hypothetical protein
MVSLRHILHALSAVSLAWAALAAGCVDSKCYRKEDCAAGQICQTVTGACVAPECTAHSQCAQGKICENGACVTGCLADKECEQGKQCIKNRCVVLENQCGCALATRFCLPDINPSSQTAGRDVCIPDSAPGGTLVFFGSVLCSHCLTFFAQLHATRDKLMAEGLAPKLVWSQWSQVLVDASVVTTQLGGADAVVVQDTAAIGMWPAYHADWYYVAILETHGCVGFLAGPLSEATLAQDMVTIEAQWRRSMTTACPE